MSQNIVIYSKDTCGYCRAAKSLLRNKGLAFEEVNLGREPHRFEEMLRRSNNVHTVPQIFFDDQHIGGFMELRQYFMARG